MSLLFLFITVCTASVSGQAHVYPVQVAKAVKANRSVILDANINQVEYPGKGKLTGFVLTNGERKGQEAEDNTESYLSYDEDFLYVAVVTELPKRDFKTTAVKHDDPQIFYDDRIELFLDVNHDHRSYFNLVLNADGQQLDQEVFQPLAGTRTHFTDVSWNAFWKAKTKTEGGKWISEIAINLASIGLNEIQDGITIGFNVGVVKSPTVQPGEASRTFLVQDPTIYSAWTFVQDGIWETISNFNTPHQFGDLIFGESKVQVTSISFPDASYQGKLGKPSLQGYNPIEIELENPVQDVDLLLEVAVSEKGGKFGKGTQEIVIWSHQQKVNRSIQIKSDYYISNEQENKLVVKLVDSKTQQVLYHTSYIMIVPPFLKYDLEPLYSKAAADQPITFTKNFDSIPDGENILRIQFLDQGMAIDSAIVEDFGDLKNAQPLFNPKKICGLPGGNYQIRSSIINGESGELVHDFIQPVTKFDPDHKQTQLEAVEEEYSYGGLSGHAVTVKLPGGAKFVFWKLASYVPWWDIDQASTSNEFVEAWGGGIEGCAEPLQDRECRFSSVVIMENTPARVKIKWQYALNDVHYRIYANEWVDEYYTFYPDGTGVREVVLHANTNTEHEVFEAIYVNPPQVSTYQLYDEEVASIKNLKGEEYTISKFREDPKLHAAFVQKDHHLIYETHFKDRLHPFTVMAFGDTSILPRVQTETINLGRRLASNDSRRGHWPASRYAVDGYNAVGDDVPGHFNLGNIHVMSEQSDEPNRWLFLIGVKAEDGKEDIAYARDWLSPPSLQGAGRNAPEAVYNRSERAYRVRLHNRLKETSFRLSDSDVLNPVLLFEGPGLVGLEAVQLNGRILDDSKYILGKSENKVYVYLNLNLKPKDRLTLHWK